MRCKNNFCVYNIGNVCQKETVNFSSYGICEDVSVTDEQHKNKIVNFKNLVES